MVFFLGLAGVVLAMKRPAEPTTKTSKVAAVACGLASACVLQTLGCVADQRVASGAPSACEILARPTFRAMLGRCGVCAGEGIRRGGGYSLVILQGKEGIPFTNSTREGGHFGLFPCLAEHAPEARFFKQLPWCWQAKTRG